MSENKSSIQDLIKSKKLFTKELDQLPNLKNDDANQVLSAYYCASLLYLDSMIEEETREEKD